MNCGSSLSAVHGMLTVFIYVYIYISDIINKNIATC